METRAIGGQISPMQEQQAQAQPRTERIDSEPQQPKFSEVWNQIQAKYGAKPKPPREIKKTLGKDDFLRIMVTQMQHQDPTKPFDADKLGSEIAQITSVEQLQNVNQALAKLATQNQPLERLAMTNLIGKTVSVDMNRFNHVENTNEVLSFTLPQKAQQVKLSVVGPGGDVVYEKELMDQPEGQISINWDGKRNNGLPVKNGHYMLSVAAINERGQSIQTQMQGKAKVIGLSFEGNEPVFLIGDARAQSKVTMGNIVRIEDDTGPIKSTVINGQHEAQPQQQPQQQASAPQPQKQQLTQEPQVPPEILQQLQKQFQQSEQAESQPQQSPQAQRGPAIIPGTDMTAEQLRQQSLAQAYKQPAADEKGFPNGLSDSQELNEPSNQSKINTMKGGEPNERK